MLTINTSGLVAGLTPAAMPWRSKLLGFGSPAFALIGVVIVGRRRRMWIGATVLAIMAVLALVGCGGGSANSTSTNSASSVPAAHYNVVVTATSGNLQQSTTLDVTVN
jgi:hypothetical protein